jgi:hypothetical protein
MGDLYLYSRKSEETVYCIETYFSEDYPLQNLSSKESEDALALALSHLKVSLRYRG